MKNNANPIMRRNHIHHGRDVGIFTFDNGMVRARGGWLGTGEMVRGWVSGVGGMASGREDDWVWTGTGRWVSLVVWVGVGTRRSGLGATY